MYAKWDYQMLCHLVDANWFKAQNAKRTETEILILAFQAIMSVGKIKGIWPEMAR